VSGFQIQKLTPRELLLICGSAVFLVMTALVVFVGKPLFARFETSAEELDGLRSLAHVPVDTGLSALQQEVDQLRTVLEGDLKNLPERQLESHMVSAFQSASWQHDVNLVTIEPVPSAVELPYQELTFRLELTGSYNNLDNWMQSVHTQLGYVVFNEYVLKVKTPGSEPELSARLVLSAYRMRDNH
jgi:Tfp pilus assembly protein PilO